MTLNQIADMIAERFAIDRARMSVRGDMVSWPTTGGGLIVIHQNQEILTEARSGGTDAHGSGAVLASISLPWYRHDLIPWTVEHVSTIVLQARAHGVP